MLQQLLEDESIPKTTHNGKYEYLVFQNYGITLKAIDFDTMLAAFLVAPGEQYGLKDLERRFLAISMTTYKDVAGKGESQINF